MFFFTRLGAYNPVRIGFSHCGAVFASLVLAILAGPVEAVEQSLLVIDAPAVGRLAQGRAPEPLTFLDASPLDTYQRVRLTGALRVGELDAAKRPFPLSSTLVIYDFSLGGKGAAEAARTWIDAGYKSVHILRGGFASAHDAKISVDMAAPLADVLPYVVTAQSLADALKQKEEITIFDLRSEIEFAASHISGAANVKTTDLLAKVATSDKTKWIVLYDAIGNSLDPLIWQLRKAGYLQTVSLSGGYKAWESEQTPKSPGVR